MSIRTKRNSRRFIAAAAAVAVAVSTFASTSPVSAIDPTLGSSTVATDGRIAGADRYETATRAADAFLTRRTVTGWNSLVIAAGDRAPDALSASGLAGALNAPIILLPSDGTMPESVREWALTRRQTIQAESTLTAAFTIYVVGGESAVPDASIAALRAVIDKDDATPTTLVRLAGADRYETSKEINLVKNALGSNIVLGAADTVVLVDGRGFADALSIAPIAFNMGWPVVLTQGTSLGDEAKAVLTAYRTLATAAGSNILIIGGTAAVAASVEEELVGMNFPYRNITRLAGADRYATSVQVNVFAAGGLSAFNAGNITLVNGEGFADALASAPLLGFGASGTARHAMLTSSGSLPPAAAGLLAAIADPSHDLGPAPTNLYVIGGTSAVSEAVVTAATAGTTSVNAASGLTCTYRSVDSGDSTVTLSIDGNLTNDAAGAGNGFVKGTNEASLLKHGSITVNGSAIASPIASVVLDTVAYSAVTGKTTFTVTVGAAATPTTTTPNVVAFSGLTQAQNTVGKRVIAAASCSIAQVTAPTGVTILANIANVSPAVPAAGVFYAQFGRAVASVPDGPNSGFTASNSAFAIAATISAASAVNPAADGTSTLWKLTLEAPATVGAGTTITAAMGSAYTDIHGIDGPLAAVSKTLTATDVDLVAPTFTGSAVCTQTEVTTQLTGGGITLDARFDKGLPGVLGNQYSMSVVNQRGRVIPSVIVNDTTKTITITADLAYSSTADIAKVMSNSGITAWTVDLPGNANAAVGGTGTLVPATYLTGTAGTQLCSIRLAASERIHNPIGETATVVFNGIAVGNGLTAAVRAGSGGDQILEVTGASIPLPVTAGTITVTLTGAVYDIAGNAAPVSVAF